jgi:hypothetical protein
MEIVTFVLGVHVILRFTVLSRGVMLNTEYAPKLRVAGETPHAASETPAMAAREKKVKQIILNNILMFFCQ